jgi:hypothetical protein
MFDMIVLISFYKELRSNEENNTFLENQPKGEGPSRTGEVFVMLC